MHYKAVHHHLLRTLLFFTYTHRVLKKLLRGSLGGGLAPVFGPGRDPGVPGSSPTSGSCMEPAKPAGAPARALFQL